MMRNRKVWGVLGLLLALVVVVGYGEPWHDWPMFHHDPQRTGRASGAGIITNADNLAWIFDTRTQPGGDPKGNIVASPVIANDGTIYVASTSSGKGTVYALDPSGNLKPAWPFEVDAEIYATPAISPDNTVYLGTFNSSASNFFALNPNGTVKWTLAVPSAFHLLSSPAVVTEANNPVIYVGGWDDGCLYKIIDGGSSGSIAWRQCLSVANYISSPAVGPSGKIYVGIIDPNDARGKIVALDPSGVERWRIPLTTTAGQGEWVSSPAVAVVHYPEFFRDLPPGDYETVFAGTSDHRMRAVRERSPTEGQIVMDFGASGGIRGSTPAIYDLNGDGWVEVIFGTCSITNHVYAVSFKPLGSLAPQGFSEEYWRYPTGSLGNGAIVASPAVALAPQPTVFVPVENKVYSLSWDRTTYNGNYHPRYVESYTTGDYITSSPAVAQPITGLIGGAGWVFVGSNDGKLYAFGPSQKSTLTVLATLKVEDVITEANVRIRIDGGTEVTPFSKVFNQGQIVTMMAPTSLLRLTLAPPFISVVPFNRWVCDDTSSTKPTIVVTMTKDMTCTAYYEK